MLVGVDRKLVRSDGAHVQSAADPVCSSVEGLDYDPFPAAGNELSRNPHPVGETASNPPSKTVGFAL